MITTADPIQVAIRPFKKASVKFWIAIGVLSAIVLVGIFAWVIQLRLGMGAAGYTDRSFWAIYIADVVAFIGVSYGGAVVSAILLITGVSWRAPLARLSEGMAVVTVLIGAALIVPHLGRPDRLMNMFLQPNFKSPVFWDFVAITTYMLASFVFFLVPLIPDMAILLEEHPNELGKRRTTLYKFFSKGWIGSNKQHKTLHGAITILAILIIPLAVSVHSVLSWAFSLVSRPGWHESIWAPYFVIAALYSGVALVIIVTAAFRRGYHLEEFIHERHFIRLGFLMAALGATYLYLTFADILPGAYLGERGVSQVVFDTIAGKFAISFWLFIIAGGVAPIILVALPQTRNIWGIVIASVLVVIALWLKRLVMVIETAHYDRLTQSFGDYYHFTWIPIAITLAATAAIPLLLMLLFRVFPILAINEIQEAESEEEALHASKSTSMAMKASVGAFILVAAVSAISIVGATPSVAAQDNLSLTAVTSGAKVTLTATVLNGMVPVYDAPVDFYESTKMFKPGTNPIPLGRELTDINGIASLTYTSVVNGPKNVSVTYYADVEGEPAIASTDIDINGAISPYEERAPKVLAGAGQVLVKVLFTLVFIVFVTVIAQIVRLRRVMRLQ
ncbi:MAG: NrfD/PsrC family molybdoenzyme membrane anchor subunit [Candidatus Planktophila sp.]|nr:NrfD/PsrC family molybdoenzyme membrane anchor subunit [Candidatus Planktophila sp.]